MSSTEYLLLALVILVPLAIAVAVTLWSIDQARYRPKRPRRSTGQRPSPSAPEPPERGDTS